MPVRGFVTGSIACKFHKTAAPSLSVPASQGEFGLKGEEPWSSVEIEPVSECATPPDPSKSHASKHGHHHRQRTTFCQD